MGLINGEIVFPAENTNSLVQQKYVNICKGNLRLLKIYVHLCTNKKIVNSRCGIYNLFCLLENTP